MDMYQKRKMRQEKKNIDSQKSFSKVSISGIYRLKENFLERFINKGFK